MKPFACMLRLVLACLMWGLEISAVSSAEPALMMPRAGDALLLDVAVAGNHLVAVGERGHILVSDGDGENWQQVTVPVRQMLTAVYFVDELRGWVVGHDGAILASQDGGRSWSLQYSGLQQQPMINQENLDAALRKRDELERDLLSADDEEFRADLVLALEEVQLDIEDAEYVLAEPVHASPLLNIYFSDHLRGYAVGAFGEFLYTLDGGVNWQRDTTRLDNPEQMHLNAITGGPGGLVWVAGESGLLFRSADYGESWQRLESPYHGSFFDIAFEPVNHRLLVVGLRGNIFSSSNLGDNWQSAQVDVSRSLAAVTWLNPRYAASVGAVGSLQLSTDGGVSFHDHSLPARAGLSAVVLHRGRLVATGQGGIYSFRDLGDFSD